MLPDFLAGSYKRYKEDTELFTTWVAKAAASSEYKPKATKRHDSENGPSKPSKPPAPAKSSEVTETLASATNLSGRLKGKDRKAAKGVANKIKKPTDELSETQAPTTVRYTITTKELLRQAEAVTESRVKSRVEMPSSLRSVVQRAIRARQRCSKWFQKSGVQNQHADKQHLHFIEVLEKSLKILEPCVETQKTALLHQKQDGTSLDTPSITNRFTALPVEESPDIDPSEVTELAAAVNVAEKTKTSKGKPEVAVYGLEEEDKFDEDLAFIIFCFFEDLHRTQAFIGELWSKYKARKCDLHTAAVATNAAFDLVRQAEEDILARAPEYFDRKRSWDSIAIIIFYADAFEQGICPEARLNSKDSLRITPFDDFIYLSTARILMKFTYLADLPADCDLGYPLPCPPLRFGYISRPDLLGTPEMDKREQEDLFLSRFLIDRHLWSIYKGIEHESRTPPPPEDELSQSLDKLMKDGVLSVALVFEARVLLDIQHIMGDEIKRGYQDLLQVTSSIDKIMNLKVVDGAWDVGGTGERWHERDVDIVMRIKETSTNWILETPTNAFPRLKELTLSSQDYKEELQRAPTLGVGPQLRVPTHIARAPKRELRTSKTRPSKDPDFSTVSMSVHRFPNGVDPHDPNFKRLLKGEMVDSDGLPNDGPDDMEYAKNARKMNIKSIQPSADLNFLRSTNPIYCGLVSFSIITDFEAAGIALCNWHESIWPTAHLYNALQRTSNSSKTWPEMEELIDFHMGALFANQLPLSAHEIFVRFALALGLPISYFSRNSRNCSNGMRSRREANGTKLEVTKISNIFRHYFEQKLSLETCLVTLDAILRKPGARATRKEKDAWSRPLTTLQFLSMLEAKLPRISQRLQFDYITLTKQCCNLLKNVRQQIGLELQINYPRIPSEDSADRTLSWVVMLILEENNEMVSAIENSSRGAPAPLVGPQLAVARQEMRKFLSTYRPQDLISNFNALLRPTHTSSGMCPNHWNISIRHVPLTPPGDLVYFVQPNSYYVHSEGPIQIAEGQPPGHLLNPKSLLTLQTIARLIMKAFTEGMGANMTSAPWSWATNDSNFARRIIKVMTDMGVRKDLMNMQVAGADELRICDESWDNMRQRLTGVVNGLPN